jgi:hypothetical protein
MDANRSTAGDERNTPFELPDSMNDAMSGLDSGGEPDVSDGFPRREPEDIPQESLAERIRRDREGS